MKILRFLLFLLADCLFSVPTMGQDNYIEYWSGIKKAESAILESNFTQAIQIYDSLFTIFPKIMIKNCYTAAQTATVLGDNLKAFHFLERGVRGGFDIKWIDRDSLLIQLKNDAYWETFTNKIQAMQSSYLSGINYELKLKVDSLRSIDIYWHDLSEDRPNNRRLFKKWMNVLADVVENGLIPIIKEYGFPSEQLIGVDTSFYMENVPYLSTTNYSAAIMLVHYYSIPRRNDYNMLYYKELEKGNLPPSDLARFVDYQVKWGKRKSYKGLPYGEYFTFKKLEKESFEEITSNRKNIGLESLCKHRQKWKRGNEIFHQKQEGNYKHIYLFKTYHDSFHP